LILKIKHFKKKTFLEAATFQRTFPLDGSLRNDPEFRNTDLDFSGCHNWIFDYLPLHHPFRHIIDFFGPPRAFFLVGDLVLGKTLCFREEAVIGCPVLSQLLSDFR
jgi:hypothetical protein